jgi:hypothetical protein
MADWEAGLVVWSGQSAGLQMGINRRLINVAPSRTNTDDSPRALQGSKAAMMIYRSNVVQMRVQKIIHSQKDFRSLLYLPWKMHIINPRFPLMGEVLRLFSPTTSMRHDVGTEFAESFELQPYPAPPAFAYAGAKESRRGSLQSMSSVRSSKSHAECESVWRDTW